MIYGLDIFLNIMFDEEKLKPVLSEIFEININEILIISIENILKQEVNDNIKILCTYVTYSNTEYKFQLTLNFRYNKERVLINRQLISILTKLCEKLDCNIIVDDLIGGSEDWLIFSPHRDFKKVFFDTDEYDSQL